MHFDSAEKYSTNDTVSVDSRLATRPSAVANGAVYRIPRICGRMVKHGSSAMETLEVVCRSRGCVIRL